jgi:hypothetical protein
MTCSSGFATRLVLQRQLRGIGSGVLLEHLEDLLPESGVAPAVIATVDRLPGAEVRRQIAPSRSRPRYPEHAGEHGAVVMGGTTRAGFLRREERSDARPPRLGQIGDGVVADLDGERGLGVGLLPRPPCCVAAPGDGLVPAPKDRPGEPEAAAFRGLSERQQQAADFRDGERDQPGRAPFFPASAWCRVTSR